MAFAKIHSNVVTSTVFFEAALAKERTFKKRDDCRRHCHHFSLPVHLHNVDLMETCAMSSSHLSHFAKKHLRLSFFFFHSGRFQTTPVESLPSKFTRMAAIFGTSDRRNASRRNHTPNKEPQTAFNFFFNSSRAQLLQSALWSLVFVERMKKIHVRQ